MNKLLYLLFLIIANAKCVSRNPFSYGINDKFKYVGFGVIRDDLCALISVNNQLFKVTSKDSRLGKYSIISLTQDFIILEDNFDNRLKININ